jgi:hypothetical protein
MVESDVRLLAPVFAHLAAAALLGQPPPPGDPIKPVKTIRLFNGKDLGAFYTWLKDSRYDDPKRVFTVEKGVIRISGEEWGGLVTRQAFRDYHLVVEWKWGGKTWPPRGDRARDSGILVHSNGPDGAYGGVWMESIEHQIIEGGCGDFIVVRGSGGASLTVEAEIGPGKEMYWKRGAEAITRTSGRFDWFGRDPDWKDVLNFRGPRDVERPTGEWNRSETICDGPRIINIVNGVTVNEAIRAVPDYGRIQIQSEGAEILIRVFELRPVAKSKKSARTTP